MVCNKWTLWILVGLGSYVNVLCLHGPCTISCENPLDRQIETLNTNPDVPSKELDKRTSNRLVIQWM